MSEVQVGGVDGHGYTVIEARSGEVTLFDPNNSKDYTNETYPMTPPSGYEIRERGCFTVPFKKFKVWNKGGIMKICLSEVGSEWEGITIVSVPDASS